MIERSLERDPETELGKHQIKKKMMREDSQREERERESGSLIDTDMKRTKTERGRDSFSEKGEAKRELAVETDADLETRERKSSSWWF